MKPTFLKRTARTTHLSFKLVPAGIFPACLIILAIPCVSCAGGGNDVDRILNALSAERVQLENIKITARETNVLFNEYNPVFQLSDSSSQLRKQEIKKIKSLLGNSSKIVTNVRTNIYQFRKDTVMTTWLGLNEQTRQTEERTLVTAGEVCVLRSFLGRKDNTNISAMGEIYSRAGNLVVGWPCFLSKSILAQWIKEVAAADCSVGLSSQGIECYIVALSSFSQSVGMNYKLFVRKDDLSPVELASYSSDGRPYSISELQYGEGYHTSFCKRAMTRTYSGNHVFQETTWILVAIEKDAEPAIENLDAFFPEGTQISDTRFSKPIAYTKGTRLPNPKEVKGMLEGPRGVVPYEVVTHSAPELAKLKARASRTGPESRRRTTAILVLFVSAASLPVIVAVLWSLRKRGKTIPPLL